MAKRFNTSPSNSSAIPAAAYVIAIYMAVAIGRIPELFPQLAALQLGKLSIVISIVALLFSKAESNTASDSKIARLVIMFSLLSVVSVAYSIWGTGSLEFLEKDVLRFFLIFLLIYKTTTNIETIRFYSYVLASILTIMAVIFLMSQSGARTTISSTYDANDVALILLTLSSLVFCSFQSAKSKVRISMQALGILGFATVLMTGSRGGFLGLCGVAAYLMFSLSRPAGDRFYRIPGPKVIVGTVLAAIILASLAPQESWDRIVTVFEIEEDYNTTAERGRLAIWGRGLEVLISRPWGVGGGAYSAADGGSGGMYMTAHNSLIQVAVELGIPGIWIYLLLYKASWRTTRQTIASSGGIDESLFLRDLARGLRAAIIAHTITGFFLSFGYSRLFFALLALAAAMEILVQKNGREENTVLDRAAR